MENLFFTQGMGFARVLHGAQKGRDIGLYALLLTGFSLLSSLLMIPLGNLLPTQEFVWLGLLGAAVMAACYLLGLPGAGDPVPGSLPKGALVPGAGGH